MCAQMFQAEIYVFFSCRHYTLNPSITLVKAFFCLSDGLPPWMILIVTCSYRKLMALKSSITFSLSGEILYILGPNAASISHLSVSWLSHLSINQRPPDR